MEVKLLSLCVIVCLLLNTNKIMCEKLSIDSIALYFSVFSLDPLLNYITGKCYFFKYISSINPLPLTCYFSPLSDFIPFY